MTSVQVRNIRGEVVGSVELDDRVFGIEPNRGVVHQAVVAQLANQRKGTHDTKTRGEVRGGTHKMWRQKGTGRARQGDRRAPHWKGGVPGASKRLVLIRTAVKGGLAKGGVAK